jgi:hypothetical protein
MYVTMYDVRYHCHVRRTPTHSSCYFQPPSPVMLECSLTESMGHGAHTRLLSYHTRDNHTSDERVRFPPPRIRIHTYTYTVTYIHTHIHTHVHTLLHTHVYIRILFVLLIPNSCS